MNAQRNLHTGDTLTILTRTPSGSMTGTNARIICIVDLMRDHRLNCSGIPPRTKSGTNSPNTGIEGILSGI